MGDWGSNVFENDDALEFAADLREAEEPNEFLREFFERFLRATSVGFDSSEYSGIWRPVREVMAAADLIVRSLGGEGDGRAPSTITGWLDAGKFRGSGHIVGLAIKALQKLRESVLINSEAREIVDGSVRRLIEKLGASEEGS